MHAKTDASLIPIKTDRMKEKVISPLLKWAQRLILGGNCQRQYAKDIY